MKSKTVSFVVQGLLFVASAVAIAPPAALATGDKVGEFTLSAPVQWGEVTLSAGTYTIAPATISGSNMFRVYKVSNAAEGYFIPSIEMEAIPASAQKPQLILGEKGGITYVKELQLGTEGLGFHYAAPKLKKSGRL